MIKKDPQLKNPVEEINSALDECSRTLGFALGFIGVNKVSGTRTINCDGKTYEISIEAKILLV